MIVKIHSIIGRSDVYYCPDREKLKALDAARPQECSLIAANSGSVNLAMSGSSSQKQVGSKRWPFLRELLAELPLLVSCNRQSKRDERCDKWLNHVNRFKKIHQLKSVGSVSIHFLADHLKILDQKFATLLQFHALTTLLVSLLVRRLDSTPLLEQFLRLPWVPLGFAAFLGVVWSFITFLCLRGVGRVVWGDLLSLA